MPGPIQIQIQRALMEFFPGWESTDAKTEPESQGSIKKQHITITVRWVRGRDDVPGTYLGHAHIKGTPTHAFGNSTLMSVVESLRKAVPDPQGSRTKAQRVAASLRKRPGLLCEVINELWPEVLSEVLPKVADRWQSAMSLERPDIRDHWYRRSLKDQSDAATVRWVSPKGWAWKVRGINTDKVVAEGEGYHDVDIAQAAVDLAMRDAGWVLLP